MRIEAVTLDAFGTVLDTGRAALLEVAREVVAREKLRLRPEAFLAAWDEIFFGLDRAPGLGADGFLTLTEATGLSLSRALAQFGAQGPPGPYVESLLRRWRRARPFPDARAALGRLRGVPVAIVSNADDAFLREILDRNGVGVRIVITSEATRSYKPDPRIFAAALSALGTPAERTLHVGDSYVEDVVGSKRAGMSAAWLNRAGLPRPSAGPAADFEVSDLLAVARLLGR